MAGYSIKFLPFLAVGAIAFGGVYVYVGINTMVLGAPGWGAAITVFGLLGILLGVVLWRVRRRLASRLSPPGERPAPR